MKNCEKSHHIGYEVVKILHVREKIYVHVKHAKDSSSLPLCPLQDKVDCTDYDFDVDGHYTYIICTWISNFCAYNT